MAEAAPIKVFIIVYRSGAAKIIGACYWNEQEAKNECARLNIESSFSHATYVARELPYPDFLDTGINLDPRPPPWAA